MRLPVHPLVPLLLALGACAPPAPEAPRGVLLVSVDSLRADHLSCYGYESSTRPDLDTSPVIDRLLARDGTRFTRAVSTTSWTLPSHMAMLTGLPNELHGVREIGFQLDPSHRLLAEVFRDAGWRTAGFWAGPNLHPWFGFERGFERYVDCSSSRVGGDGEEVFGAKGGMERRALDALRANLKQVHEGSHRGVTGPDTVAAFREWLASIGDGERFFAFVHLWDVHYDYTPPPEFDLFFPGYRGEEDGVDVHERSFERHPPSPEDLARIVSLYDGEIRFTDHNLGTILGELEGRGRLDDTLVVFTADHGEEFLEHKLFGHGNSLYEEAVRIPLILRYPPAVPGGETVDDAVGLVDLAPTILDFCGLPAPRGTWGRSLRLALEGELEPRVLPLERTFLRPGEELVMQTIRGVHAGEYKVIRQTDADGGKMFFYDLVADPREQDPLLTGKLGKGDERVLSARELWTTLDRRGGRPGRAKRVPERLEDDLGKVGYVEED